MEKKRAELINKFSKYPLNPNVKLEDVTDEEEEEVEQPPPAVEKKRSRSPSPQPGFSGFRRSSRLRNKKKTANSKSRSVSPSPQPNFSGFRRLKSKKKTANSKSRSVSPSSSIGKVSTASENREKAKKRRKKSRSSSASSSSSSSSSISSRSSSTDPLQDIISNGFYTLKHKVNGNVIKFISNIPFTNNKLPKKACRYFTKSCMQRILTKRDKKKKNVTVLLKKINPNR